MAFIALLLLAYLFGAVLVIVFHLGLYLLLYAFYFLAITVRITVTFSGRGLLWVLIRLGKIHLRVAAFVARGTGRTLVLAGRGIHFSILLLYFLTDEQLRSSADEPCDEEPDDDYGPSFDDEADEAAAQSELEAAIALFGLALTVTRDELHRAYKTAIRKAHPDLGGSVEQAQELNVARDLIMSAHGWT